MIVKDKILNLFKLTIMKNFILTFALIFAFGTLSFAQSIRVNPKVTKNLRTTKTTMRYPHQLTLRPNCPDLAALQIKVEKISGGAYSGKIKITGIVKNIGRKDFVSNPAQMSIALYEVRPGGATVLRKKASFANIPAGRTAQLAPYYTNWYTGNEFPSNFRLVIMYDPDISMDNNPRNDDCNSGNNVKEVTGYTIHNIFRSAR